jgi:hypothetical protein
VNRINLPLILFVTSVVKRADGHRNENKNKGKVPAAISFSFRLYLCAAGVIVAIRETGK